MKNKTQIDLTAKTVVKSFRSRIACDKEKHILTQLTDTGLVPKLFSCDGFSVTMEYCDGVLLSELFRSDDCEAICAAIQKLAEWFEMFERSILEKTGEYITLEDINPRNFIYDPRSDSIRGIDFEAWHTGGPSENLLYMPAMVRTSQFCNEELSKASFDLALQIAADQSGKCFEHVCGLVNTAVEKRLLRRRIMAFVRQCDCVVIAGGKSSRMGSPKGLLRLGGYTFVDKLIYSAQIFDTVYISANTDDYSCFNCDTIVDIYKDKGPIGAIHAALSKTKKDKVFFIPCDTPFITEKTIIDFFGKADQDAECNVMRYRDRVYPTIAVYDKSILPVVEQQIEQDCLKMMLLLERMYTHFVSAGSEYELTNINTPQDYNLLKG